MTRMPRWYDPLIIVAAGGYVAWHARSWWAVATLALGITAGLAFAGWIRNR